MIHRCFIYITWNVSYHFVSCEWRTLILAFRCIVIWTRLANVNIWVKFWSRNSEVFKIYTKYLSFLVYNQGYNLFFVPYVLVWLHFCDETETNHCEIPALSTWHESRGRAVLDSIALRKHDTQRLFLICVKKNSICNLHVIGMPLNEQITSIFFSYDVVLPIASLWFPSLSIKPRNVNNVFSLVVCFGSTLFPYPDRSVSLGKNLMRFAVILQHAI